jgi:hypothetical protein
MNDSERNAAATKGDLADMKAEILESMRDVETKLLNAFYGYTKNNDKRILETEANESVLRMRMGVLEMRVTDVEERLNRPPQH